MNIKLTSKEKIRLSSPGDVYNIMRTILLREQKLDRDKEHFWMIGLSTGSRILYIELVSMGGANSTTVEPMNVFRFAVMKGAAAVIMVHNHPGGGLEPSAADKDMTDRLIQVGRILDVIVFDHLIISAKSYMSFQNTGLFRELEKSLKYVPTFEIIERIRAEEKMIREEAVAMAVEKEKKAKQIAAEKAKKEKLAAMEKAKKEKQIAVEKAEKKKAIEMARKMKNKNEPIERIVEYTGLTKGEIGNIKK